RPRERPPQDGGQDRRPPAVVRQDRRREGRVNYFVGIREADGKYQVYLDRRDGSRSDGMPMGTFDKPEQAGTAAHFLSRALHERFVAGLEEAHSSALASLTAAMTRGRE